MMKMKFAPAGVQKGAVTLTEQGLRVSTEAGEVAELAPNANDEVTEVTFLDLKTGAREAVEIPAEMGETVLSSSSTPKEDVA